MATTASRLQRVEETAAQVMTWGEMAEMIAQIFYAVDISVNLTDAAKFKAEVLRVLEPPEFRTYLREWFEGVNDGNDT